MQRRHPSQQLSRYLKAEIRRRASSWLRPLVRAQHKGAPEVKYGTDEVTRIMSAYAAFAHGESWYSGPSYARKLLLNLARPGKNHITFRDIFRLDIDCATALGSALLLCLNENVHQASSWNYGAANPTNFLEIPSTPVVEEGQNKARLVLPQTENPQTEIVKEVPSNPATIEAIKLAHRRPMGAARVEGIPPPSSPKAAQLWAYRRLLNYLAIAPDRTGLPIDEMLRAALRKRSGQILIPKTRQHLPERARWALEEFELLFGNLHFRVGPENSWKHARAIAGLMKIVDPHAPPAAKLRAAVTQFRPQK